MQPIKSTFRFSALFFACSAGLIASASAQDADSVEWPGFRGPTNTGTSATAKPPTTWSDTENIAWKQKIPGKGTSSPVVIGNRVYITAAKPADKDAPKPPTQEEIIKKFDANGDGQLDRNERRGARSAMQKMMIQKQKFVVLCYDRSSGDPVWEKVANEAMPHEGHHSDHGYASASPTTDGEYLYINFGSFGLYCYDLEGNLKWKRDDLGKMTMRGKFGEGSSVAVHDNLVILPWDHEGQSRIEAINKDNGETVWKTMRDEPSNWATPMVVEVDGRTQVLQPGQNYSRGYDFENGEEIWRASGLSQRPVASPLVVGDLALFASARGGAVLQAIPLNQTGDVSPPGIAWKINRQTPDIPSMVLSENRLFFVGGNSPVLTCVNAETGESIFEPQRLPVGNIYSSPVAANGKVYVTGRGGKTVVLDDAVTFNIVSTNDVGEPVDATLALAGEDIFIRGKDHLFCIRNN